MQRNLATYYYRRLNRFLRYFLYAASYKLRIFDRTLFNRYPYLHEPHQLKYLMDVVDETADIEGCCLEIGCSYGATTVLLNKYLRSKEIKKSYVALDTFSGFVDTDVQFEVKQRNKSPRMAATFTMNHPHWVEHSLRLAGIEGVTLYKADCSDFDYSELGPVAFCLLDVDLYRPVMLVLEKLYPIMPDGGIIVIDDCQPHDDWDGALEAYKEFTQRNRLPCLIEAGKYGIIKKKCD